MSILKYYSGLFSTYSYFLMKNSGTSFRYSCRSLSKSMAVGGFIKAHPYDCFCMMAPHSTYDNDFVCSTSNLHRPLVCRWTIRSADADEVVNLSFPEMRLLDGDVVDIYNGTSGTVLKQCTLMRNSTIINTVLCPPVPSLIRHRYRIS